MSAREGGGRDHLTRITSVASCSEVSWRVAGGENRDLRSWSNTITQRISQQRVGPGSDRTTYAVVKNDLSSMEETHGERLGSSHRWGNHLRPAITQITDE